MSSRDRPDAADLRHLHEAVSREKQPGQVSRIERRIIELAGRWFEPAARIAIFIIYFWFGLLKLIGLSPATPLASALTARTIGMQYFNASFKALAVYECGLGILFLIPAMTRISAVLLVIHMGIVSTPLVIVASVAWTHPLVPTLEGQYIIKDLAIIALAVGIIAQRRSPRDRRETRVRPQSALSAGSSAKTSLKVPGNKTRRAGSNLTRPATSYMRRGNDGYCRHVPQSFIKGAWRLDANGELTGEYVANPDYGHKKIRCPYSGNPF